MLLYLFYFFMEWKECEWVSEKERKESCISCFVHSEIRIKILLYLHLFFHFFVMMKYVFLSTIFTSPPLYVVTHALSFPLTHLLLQRCFTSYMSYNMCLTLSWYTIKSGYMHPLAPFCARWKNICSSRCCYIHRKFLLSESGEIILLKCWWK
jgi:hypothetical protein